jgi:hypothetical protein
MWVSYLDRNTFNRNEITINKERDKHMTSWKTTMAGIGAILACVGGVLKALFDNDPSTNPDWATLVPTLVAAFGLIFARDNKVSSETAGAK